MRPGRARLLVIPLVLGAGADATAQAPPRVLPNDNRAPAGVARDGALALDLVARLAAWHPDGADAEGAVVPAFAESAGAPRIPGPLVRAPAGTVVTATVRNALPDTLRIHGLHDRVGRAVDAAPLVLAPGERGTVRFALDAPGTYLYWGTTTGRQIGFRTGVDAQLSGAIVVDPSSGAPAPDRVFVIGAWTDTVARAMLRRTRFLGVVNGRSWPHTERLQATVGDSVRWRVINASADLHPMHLHGFHFRVDARGDGMVDTAFAPGARALAVTESIRAGGSVALTWVPARAGNWLFHCHIPEHFAPRAPLGMPAAPATRAAHADHALGGMSGLVVGVSVLPAGAAADASSRADDARRAERRLRLLVRPNAGSTPATPLYGYAVHEGGPEPRPDSGLGVGPTLDLERGQPVRITVVNRLSEPTAVHWHGIELESYYDGVPGFSGVGRRVTPLIAPRDSFEVRFTPPRAGTYIYHTHADEERQHLAGLVGAIVVREPGAPRDPATDIPLVITAPTVFEDHARIALVNGRAEPAPLVLRVGTAYRLRLVQMSLTRAFLRAELWRGGELATWRPLAKDGAALPEGASTIRPAQGGLGIGETYDVEVVPDAPGDMRLEIRVGPSGTPGVLLATVPVRVTPP